MKISANGRQAILGLVNGTAAGLSASVMLHSGNRVVVFISGIVLALSLFILRQEIRWFYGLIEIGFGLFLLWEASGKSRASFSADFSDDFAKFQLPCLRYHADGGSTLPLKRSRSRKG